MKENQNIYLVGSKIILVPYRRYHVAKYHEWMSDPEIRKLTASEPLTLDEEYEMQQKWVDDIDKCTFIVLEKKLNYENYVDDMIGDVNLFFQLDPNTNCRTNDAELEVMIADRNSRRKGFGQEACVLMMLYGYRTLKVRQFSVKIGRDNEASLKMFNKLGFVEQSYSDVFDEFTLMLEVENKALQNFQVYDYNECYFNT